MSDKLIHMGEHGRVFIAGKNIDIAGLPWHPNAKFSGVAMKHLVTAQDTNGAFSCHLVRVEKGCEIGDHIHEGKWELHEVLAGTGTCLIGGQEIAYQAGVSALVPADTMHRVAAAEEDLYMAAKFVPALL